MKPFAYVLIIMNAVFFPSTSCVGDLDVPPIVLEYQAYFTEAITERGLLYVYSTKATNEQARIAYFDAIVSSLEKLNMPNVATICATVVSWAVASTYTRLSPTDWTKAYGIFSGKGLLKAGVLNTGNAKNLAEEFADCVKTISDQIIKEDDPATNILAQSDSFVYFMLSKTAFDEISAPRYAVYFQEELYKIVKDSD